MEVVDKKFMELLCCTLHSSRLCHGLNQGKDPNSAIHLSSRNHLTWSLNNVGHVTERNQMPFLGIGQSKASHLYAKSREAVRSNGLPSNREVCRIALSMDARPPPVATNTAMTAAHYTPNSYPPSGNAHTYPM